MSRPISRVTTFCVDRFSYYSGDFDAADTCKAGEFVAAVENLGAFEDEDDKDLRIRVSFSPVSDLEAHNAAAAAASRVTLGDVLQFRTVVTTGERAELSATGKRVPLLCRNDFGGVPCE